MGVLVSYVKWSGFSADAFTPLIREMRDRLSMTLTDIHFEAEGEARVSPIAELGDYLRQSQHPISVTATDRAGILSKASFLSSARMLYLGVDGSSTRLHLFSDGVENVSGLDAAAGLLKHLIGVFSGGYGYARRFKNPEDAIAYADDVTVLDEDLGDLSYLLATHGKKPSWATYLVSQSGPAYMRDIYPVNVFTSDQLARVLPDGRTVGEVVQTDAGEGIGSRLVRIPVDRVESTRIALGEVLFDQAYR